MTGRTTYPDDIRPESLTDFRLKRIEDAVSTMAESMQRLVELEQKHAETREALGRAFQQNSDLELRVRAIELKQASSSWIGQSMTIIGTALATAAAAIGLPHLMK